MSHPTLTIGGAILGGLLFLILLAACAMASSKATVDELQQPEPVKEPGPPAPSLPPIAVPRQRLTTERLLMSPDQRAREMDEFRELWRACGGPNPRTDLRADPGPHEPA